jgi:hypothetical protein
VSSGYGQGVRIATVLFPDVEELDFAGPWEVPSFWARAVAADAARQVKREIQYEPQPPV